MLNVKGIVGFDAREVAIQLHGKKGGEIGLPKCDNHLEGSPIERYSVVR